MHSKPTRIQFKTSHPSLSLSVFIESQQGTPCRSDANSLTGTSHLSLQIASHVTLTNRSTVAPPVTGPSNFSSLDSAQLRGLESRSCSAGTPRSCSTRRPSSNARNKPITEGSKPRCAKRHRQGAPGTLTIRLYNIRAPNHLQASQNLNMPRSPEFKALSRHWYGESVRYSCIIPPVGAHAW
eukprot:1120805-Amphidinium_carterae.1